MAWSTRGADGTIDHVCRSTRVATTHAPYLALAYGNACADG